MKTKTCTKCKETKPFSEFHKDNRNKDGLVSHCKSCISEKGRRYREANKEKIAESKRRHYEANKEKAIERSRRHREANKKQCNRRGIKRSAEINARSLELAHRHRLPWEDWEDEFILSDNGLTNYQKAVKLGRSCRSVVERKVKLRKKSRNKLTTDTVRV